MKKKVLISVFFLFLIFLNQVVYADVILMDFNTSTKPNPYSIQNVNSTSTNHRSLENVLNQKSFQIILIIIVLLTILLLVVVFFNILSTKSEKIDEEKNEDNENKD